MLQTDVLASQPWAMKASRRMRRQRLALGTMCAWAFRRQISCSSIRTSRHRTGLRGSMRVSSLPWHSCSRPRKDFEDDKRGHLFAAGAWMLVAVLQDARLSYAAVLSRFTFALTLRHACGRGVDTGARHARGDDRERLSRASRSPRCVSLRRGRHRALRKRPRRRSDRATSPQTPESPESLLAAARAALKPATPAQRFRWSTKAARWQPGCVRCLDTLGFTYFALHRAPEASSPNGARRGAVTRSRCRGASWPSIAVCASPLGQKPLDTCAR